MTHPDASARPDDDASDAPVPPNDDKRADGRTRAAQDGEPTPRMPHERDQTAGGQGTQERTDDRTREDQTGISRRAYDDAVSDSVDTSSAPVTDKVYNEKVKP